MGKEVLASFIDQEKIQCTTPKQPGDYLITQKDIHNGTETPLNSTRPRKYIFEVYDNKTLLGYFKLGLGSDGTVSYRAHEIYSTDIAENNLWRKLSPSERKKIKIIADKKTPIQLVD